MQPSALRIHKAALRIFADHGGSSVAISELAREAGVSRGTVYNNLDDPADLFPALCALLADEFLDSVNGVCAGMEDPAEKISAAIRLGVRRVHDEPHWGRFIARYAMLEPRLGTFWGAMPAAELRRGIASGRFSLRPEQVPSATATAGGATFGAISIVLDGRRAWREAGTDAAEIVLRGIGVPAREARVISHQPLPALPLVFDYEGV
ncbi:TetR/AcrR family transcriptional regulator [Rhodovulum sp. DZ06]|uniref:TetR/AcrR family transcriptional regulator n=1 Tax=Rhodovulum sp. DZ06 TaxID=3425126 RepID=UPI003D32B770